MTTYAEYRVQFADAASGDVTTLAPTHLDLELASVCNFRCPMCPQAETRVDWVKGFMPTALALRLLDEAKAIGVLSVKLNWRGESTLHPDCAPIASHAKHLGFVDVMLNTNGAYDDAELSRALCSHVDTLIFSIDSLDAARAARLRPPGKLRQVLANLDAALSAKAISGTPRSVRINFTRQAENWDELPVMEAFCQQRGVELYVKPVFPRNPPRVGFYYPEEKFMVQGRKNCGFPFQRLVVAHDGRVAPCCVPWTDTLYVGNVNNESLNSIWQSPALRMIRHDAKSAAYRHPTCVNCTSWASYQVEHV